MFSLFLKWSQSYYYADTYKIISLKIDSVSWPAKWGGDPIGRSSSYPEKGIFLTNREYFRAIHQTEDTSMGKDPDFKKNVIHQVWSSPKTNYMYGIPDEQVSFPQNKFLKNLILFILPIFIFDIWLISTLKRT